MSLIGPHSQIRIIAGQINRLAIIGPQIVDAINNFPHIQVPYENFSIAAGRIKIFGVFRETCVITVAVIHLKLVQNLFLLGVEDENLSIFIINREKVLLRS